MMREHTVGRYQVPVYFGPIVGAGYYGTGVSREILTCLERSKA